MAGINKHAPGCSCCGCSSTITISVTGCGSLAVSGASVNLTGPGGYNVTQSTSGAGSTAFSVTANGSYSYSVSKSRFNTATGSVTVTACNSPSATVALTAATGYVCCTKCADPYPSTLTASFTGGSLTLTWDGTNTWTGTVGVSNSTTGACDGSCNFTPDLCTAASGTVTVTVSLTCPTSTGGNFSLGLSCTGVQRSAGVCPPSGLDYYRDSSCDGCFTVNYIITNGTGTNPCGIPLTHSYSVSSPGGYYSAGSYVGSFSLGFPITGTIAISE